MTQIELSSMLAPMIKEIILVARYDAKKEVYPAEIVGNALASKLLGITSNAMRQRVYKGFYQEGNHFTKKSDRIYLWNRDALLDEWMEQDNESKVIFKGKRG